MLRKLLGVVLAAALLGAIFAPVVSAATEEQIQDAINTGVAWLAAQQHPDGSWDDPWVALGATGFAVVKLCDYALEQGFESPLDPAYEYSAQVAAGLAYILQHAVPSGPGVCFQAVAGDVWHETYFTGIAMMALAGARCLGDVVAVGNPVVDGQTYAQVLQKCVDYFAWAQNPDGGWRYWSEMEPSDNSNTGYAVLGLRYAESIGCTIPDSLKAALSGYIDYIQSPDGGSGYEQPGNWENVLKTGNLLFEMAFVGDDPAATRVQEALAYIAAHWNDANNDPGWRIHYQAMYCLMKGLESFAIDTISVGGTDVDWYAEFAEVIVTNQSADGSWPGDYWGTPILATEWALLTLERIAPPPQVGIDIKPGSFPNSINPGQKGTTPVAILSTEEFSAPDVVDPFSLTFGHTGDEASLAFRGKNQSTPQCSAEDVNGDGLPDLVAHFVTSLAAFEVGDEMGYLKGCTFDGMVFVASDSVRIVPPNASQKDTVDLSSLADQLAIEVYPNPVRDVHTAHFSVAGPMSELVDEMWVQIFDLSGALVWEDTLYGTAIDWHTDALSGEWLANGIYIYRVLVRVGADWIVVRLNTLAVNR